MAYYFWMKERFRVMGILILKSKDIINEQFYDNSGYGGTLLHYAAANCNKKTILTLLRWDADILLEDSEHRLPVEVAIHYKNSKLLILPYNSLFQGKNLVLKQYLDETS
jgi:ankyrin repeat protein